MIRAIRADSPTFREVRLEPGFNVIVADRTAVSLQQDSRNGIGKSTLLEIIHFCFGSSPDRSSALLSELVADWTFSVDFTVQGEEFSVSRCPARSTEVFVDGPINRFPLSPGARDDAGRGVYPIAAWNACLGALFFGLLPVHSKQDLAALGKYRPTFRSLFSYVVRRGRGAYLSPFTQYPKQQEWDKQVNNAFLLGLQWEDARDWQILRDREKDLRTLQGATATGIAKEFFGSLGELEASKVRLQGMVKERESALARFRVHPQYRDIERRADELTTRLHELTNDNVIDRQLLASYQGNIENEAAPDDQDIAGLYEEAGLQLPDLVRRRLVEVREFHNSVVENRRVFLQAEISRLTRVIDERQAQVSKLTDERSDLMSILATHGALEEYTRLQEHHTRLVQELRAVEARIELLMQVRRKKSELRIDQETLLQRAQADFASRSEQRDAAISAFNANSEALYSAPGNLVIDLTPSGFRFDVEIERSKSHGIENMKILCYDLAVAEMWADRNPSPRLLIHDSMIFDGVDERQVALALQLAAKRSEDLGFQYICTLNSDVIPSREFTDDFPLSSFIRLRLTDVSASGSLLGIRF